MSDWNTLICSTVSVKILEIIYVGALTRSL